VIGWGHVGSRLLLESDPFAELLGLVVDARRRSGGVGARLVEEAERWAVARGHFTIRVRSNVIREDAHRFYFRSGYRLSKRQAVFTKDL
jgi:Acetyltransferase (GNAT) family.